MNLKNLLFNVKGDSYWKIFTILGIKIRVCYGRYFNKNFPKLLPGSCAFFFNTLVSAWGSNPNTDFENDYKALIKNLDPESVKTVDFVLDFYRCKDKKSINSLLKKMKSFKKIHKNFYRMFESKILKLDENLYVYDKYKLPINHFESSVFYHKHSINKLKSLDKIRQKDIIDVGGFIGDSALVFSDYTDQKIYSFEPSKENFSLMKKTIELNGLNNVIPVNLALGREVDSVLYINGNDSSVRTSTIVSENSIHSTTLDNFVVQNNIKVGLIKVDIEGFEQEFLKGAEQTINTQKPVLLLSIYHNLDDYLHIKPLIESWNLGYTFRIIKPAETYFTETLLVAEVAD